MPCSVVENSSERRAERAERAERADRTWCPLDNPAHPDSQFSNETSVLPTSVINSRVSPGGRRVRTRPEMSGRGCRARATLCDGAIRAQAVVSAEQAEVKIRGGRFAATGTRDSRAPRLRRSPSIIEVRLSSHHQEREPPTPIVVWPTFPLPFGHTCALRVLERTKTKNSKHSVFAATHRKQNRVHSADLLEDERKICAQLSHNGQRAHVKHPGDAGGG